MDTVQMRLTYVASAPTGPLSKTLSALLATLIDILAGDADTEFGSVRRRTLSQAAQQLQDCLLRHVLRDCTPIIVVTNTHIGNPQSSHTS